MITYRVVFDNSKQGRAGRWTPCDKYGDDLIIDQSFDTAASDDARSVVLYAIPNDRVSERLMDAALERNVEVISFDVVKRI